MGPVATIRVRRQEVGRISPKERVTRVVGDKATALK
jgi:hypothetical protein